MDCLFCKIGKHEIPAKIVYEDDIVMAFLDIHPKVDGHVLIIPKKHFRDFTEIDQGTLFHMKEVATHLSNHLMKRLNKRGLNLSINYGEEQEIKHFHLHLLPKNKNKSALKTVDEIYEILLRKES